MARQLVEDKWGRFEGESSRSRGCLITSKIHQREYRGFTLEGSIYNKGEHVREPNDDECHGQTDGIHVGGEQCCNLKLELSQKELSDLKQPLRVDWC